MKTIAQRWVASSQAMGLANKPGPMRAALMLAFYAGYSACIDATLDLADMTEEQAMAALQAQRSELLSVEAAAHQAIHGDTIQ